LEGLDSFNIGGYLNGAPAQIKKPHLKNNINNNNKNKTIKLKEGGKIYAESEVALDNERGYVPTSRQSSLSTDGFFFQFHSRLREKKLHHLDASWVNKQKYIR
jgi:hypothetical protein